MLPALQLLQLLQLLRLLLVLLLPAIDGELALEPTKWQP